MPCPLKRLAILLLPLTLLGCKKDGLPQYPDTYREFAYVANSAGDSVSVLDLVYLRTDRTLAVGRNPVAIVANPLLDEVYVVNSQPHEPNGSVTVINTRNNAVVQTLPVHRNPVAIALAPTLGRAYVSNLGSNLISVLDLATHRVIASQPADHPSALAVAPDERTLLVANLPAGAEGGSISLFTLSAGSGMSLRTTIPGCRGATSPVILPGSLKAFIACPGQHQVMAISLAAAPDTAAARQDATAAADHLLAFLDVGSEPSQLTIKPDGGEIFVSNRASNTVSEIATQTNEVGSTYPIGNGPAHGVVSADNGALWVAASGTDSVSLYSIDDGKFLSSIRTGDAPDALAFSADQHLLLAADTRSGDVAVIRTTSRLGPALLTMLPTGGSPVALAVKAMNAKP